jgi:hypothetical protein
MDSLIFKVAEMLLSKLVTIDKIRIRIVSSLLEYSACVAAVPRRQIEIILS